MRTLLLSVSALVLITVVSSCEQADPIKKTVITGTVINFENPQELPAVQLYHNPPFLSESKIQNDFINQDGKFRFEFEQLHPVDIMMSFGEWFTVYAFPGDSINITMDARMLSDTSYSMDFPSKYIQITCPNQRFQDEYQDFRHAYLAEFETGDDRWERDVALINLNHSEFSDYVKNKSAEYQAFLENYANKHHPSSELQVWVDNWLYLHGLKDLLAYTWVYPINNNIDRDSFQLPDAYFDFLKDDRHNNEELLASQEYRTFLHELNMYLVRDFNQSEKRSQCDTLYIAGKKNEVQQMLLTHIIENSSGFEQEFLVSKFFSRLIHAKLIEAYDALYEPSIIGRKDYSQILEKEYAELQQLIAKPVYAADLNLHDSGISEEDMVFPTLPERFPGKVVYVDFWAPWCGPCMSEIPQSKALQAKLDGKEVVFVFLANRCSEDSWKATISERQLSGEHFLLTDKEYALLAEEFDISGIPRYMIIDRQGFVVNETAPRPDDESLEGLLLSLVDKENI